MAPEKDFEIDEDGFQRELIKNPKVSESDLNALLYLILKDAKWYKFWLPESGLVGGTILCSIITVFFVYFNQWCYL